MCTGHRLLALKQDEKHSFLFFSVILIKSILKLQHAENAAKSAEIDVLEFIKLQNVFAYNHGRGKVDEVSSSDLNVLICPFFFFFHFASSFP